VYTTNSNIMWGIYIYGLILYFKIRLLHLKVCMCIYRLISNNMGKLWDNIIFDNTVIMNKNQKLFIQNP